MQYLADWLLNRLDLTRLSDFDLSVEISCCAYEQQCIPGQLYYEFMRRGRSLDCCYFFRDNGSCWLWDRSRCIHVERQEVEALRLCLAPFGVKEDRQRWEESNTERRLDDDLYVHGRTFRNYALQKSSGFLSELSVVGIARIGFVVDDGFRPRTAMLLSLGCPVYRDVTEAMDASIKALMKE